MMKTKQDGILIHGAKTEHLLIAVVIACLNYYCVAQKCSRDIRNQVAYEGRPASFRRIDNGVQGMWKVAPSDLLLDPERIIIDDDDDEETLNPEFVKTYKVDSKRLTILKSTVARQRSMPYATAGLYTLNYLDPNCTTAAGLIVIRGDPECTCDRRNARVSCSVDYAAYKEQRIEPIMTWKDDNGVTLRTKQPTPSSLNVNNPGLQRSVSEFPIAAATDVRNYTCQLTFSTPSPRQPKYISRNAPSFTASCSVKNCRLRIPQTTKTSVTRSRPTTSARRLRTTKTTREATTTCKT